MSCKVGDIIVVNSYTSQGQTIGRHSFVVLSTERGQIRGLDYDLVCNVMSSFHSDEQRKKKLSYPGNIEYNAGQERILGGHGRPGYIKTDQLYYFDSNDLDYYVIGSIAPNFLRTLFEHIENLEEIEHITDNL